MADSIYAEISELRLGSSIGDRPRYFVLLIPDCVIGVFPELLTVAQFKPLPRALVERISVGVSQLELDVFVIGFHRPEFLRDPARPEPGANQRKDMQLTVSQVRNVKIRCRVVHGPSRKPSSQLARPCL